MTLMTGNFVPGNFKMNVIWIEKDEPMLTSFSECSHSRQPHCGLYNVLHVIIESNIVILLITPHLKRLAFVLSVVILLTA